ncbi:MAG TPA: PAS domain S-box protein [Syntrophorhabdus sp.]|jgi:PAS domain S-box-containing protein|nr:MAG: Sporulation kinase E [Deltaproteobacteria bacterium ADurb.Bin135]HNS79722.1 PAS domain S-box protein [Syntrophorhabdus sp.]HPB38204.1 PAS domain S-box protein [Syntrophorhabdus sp.]HPW37377.1 PAS domain S-box protein [Syntrophorhabdus sp.]HQB35495.1 PAS domain S-box protein [Syntrophorhabdus sp.]
MKKTTKDNNQIQAKNSEHIQEILSQNLNIYRLIAENMYDAIYTLDTNVNFTFVNDVALKRSGYTRKWFIGRSFLNFVIPENKNMVQKSFKSVMMGKVVPAYELSYINSKGKSLWIEINATPLVDNGNIIGVLVVSRDITERKRNEEELKLYRNNLESLIEGRTAELRIANEQLQIEIAQHKKTEEALRSSEAYYRTIFHNTGTAIIIMEDDTTISLSNAECEKFVGYRASDLEGKRRAVEFVARQDLERILSYNELRRQDPEKAPRSYELKIVDRHGNVRDVLITIASIPHTNKTIASFLDITEQKKMEAALKASEEKYRNIFENAVEGIFQIGINGEILSANPSFSHLFGYKSPQEIMRAVKDIRYEIYADESQRNELRRLLDKQGFVRNFEVICRRKDGQRIWISVNIRAVKDNNSKFLFYEGTLVDITERKMIQDDLEKKSRSLEETNAALRVLLKQREEDKTDLEEKVLHNIKELVLPYIDKLRAGQQNRDTVIIDIVESNLNEILSPFIKSMASKYANFTPKEIQIADLMKKGKSTKEISTILNLSPRTIDIHRYNIRRKLNINKKKVNLQSYLLTLT